MSKKEKWPTRNKELPTTAVRSRTSCKRKSFNNIQNEFRSSILDFCGAVLDSSGGRGLPAMQKEREMSFLETPFKKKDKLYLGLKADATPPLAVALPLTPPLLPSAVLASSSSSSSSPSSSSCPFLHLHLLFPFPFFLPFPFVSGIRSSSHSRSRCEKSEGKKSMPFLRPTSARTIRGKMREAGVDLITHRRTRLRIWRGGGGGECQ